MNISLHYYFFLGLFAFSLTSLLTPVMGKVANKFGVVDFPNSTHKTHSKPVPYLGGVSIAFGVSSVVIVSSLFVGLGSYALLLALSVLVPALALGAIGLWDDIRNLNPFPRFLVQSIFGIVISILLVKTKTLGSPFGIYLLDVTISVLWIVGITNAINFFDNIDGGASGSIVISSLCLFFLFLLSDQIILAGLAIVISGATSGFLLWNRPPARIYMGDAGSLFLGVLIGTLTLRLDPLPIDKIASFSIPFCTLAIPILDTTTAVLSRLRRRVSPFQGGRDHLSHRLMRLGLTKRVSLYLLWSLSLLFCLIAILITFAPNNLERLLTVLTLIVWTLLLLLFLSTSDK